RGEDALDLVLKRLARADVGDQALDVRVVPVRRVHYSCEDRHAILLVATVTSTLRSAPLALVGALVDQLEPPIPGHLLFCTSDGTDLDPVVSVDHVLVEVVLGLLAARSRVLVE